MAFEVFTEKSDWQERGVGVFEGCRRMENFARGIECSQK